MFDGGGPMASGGSYQGGGLLSFLGNLRNAISGRDMGQTVGYGAPMQATKKPMPRQTPVTGYYPDMAMMAIEGMGEPTTNPFAVGGGMDNILNSAFPVADVASPINTAKVTPQQNTIEEIATNVVADEMGTGFFTLPSVERQRLVQNKINELTTSLNMYCLLYTSPSPRDT